MQISTPYKKSFLLKPFINAYLAVSQLGMRQVFWVSHFVSLIASNVMGIWASPLSKSGKMRQVKAVSHSVSFFAQRDLTTFLKLSNLRTMVYGPPAGRLFISAVSNNGPWTISRGPNATRHAICISTLNS